MIFIVTSVVGYFPWASVSTNDQPRGDYFFILLQEGLVERSRKDMGIPISIKVCPVAGIPVTVEGLSKKAFIE
jgi:hypothetical protein